MAPRAVIAATFALLLVYALTGQAPSPEAFEIGRHNLGEMPKGKEADGILGDFVLRNEHLEALIGGTQPLRRANMTTEYASPIPGTLYDLDLRGEENDQLTAFRPADQKGRVSWVKPVEGLGPGAAAVETVRTGPMGDGLYTRHEYRLEKGRRHMRITTTFRNEGAGVKAVAPRAVWKGLDQEAQAGEIRAGDSIDPFDKRGYAWAPLEPRTLPEEARLRPGEERSYSIALAVGDSPLEAYGVIAALLGEASEVSGVIEGPEGAAIRAEMTSEINGATLKAYPDENGRYSIHLPAGRHELRVEDIGRETVSETVTIVAGKALEQDWQVSAASKVRGTIRDDSGRPSPAKIQFIGRNGTETPNLGTVYRVHGGDHQYQTHDGGFDQQLPPGDYLLRVTHGPEFNMEERAIRIAKGQTVEADFTLRRTVNTDGWVSTDFHAHSTPSGDNYCNTRDRLINFAAEHIEFAPTTEHNRIFDWAPLIERLGLSGRIKTVPGIELTGSGQHFNAFPLTPDPLTQNGGAPVWNYDPRINAIALRNWSTPSLQAGGTRHDTGANARVMSPEQQVDHQDRWVQANHPTVERVFFDRDGNGVRDGGFVGFETMIDAAEVWSAAILDHRPKVDRRGTEWSNRTFFWLQMLNQGRHVWCVSVSDAHRIFGNGVGDWRTYVPSSTDVPSEIDHVEIIRNAKAGRMMITNGPFLEVTTADGLPIGSSVHAEGYIDLKIRVQAANWVDVNRVQILVNGAMPEFYNFTVVNHAAMFHEGALRFEETVRVHLQEDAHLIVAAVGEGSDLSKGWGRNPQGQMQPTAYTNPIYVDTGHDGFQANGDTLGYPLPSVSDD